MTMDGSGNDADVEGEGNMATSSACAVGKSLSILLSTSGAPESEFKDVHHSVPESFCISAYLRLKVGVWNGSEVCRGGDLSLAFESAFVSVSSLRFCDCDANGKMDSRSRGMETE